MIEIIEWYDYDEKSALINGSSKPTIESGIVTFPTDTVVRLTGSAGGGGSGKSEREKAFDDACDAYAKSVDENFALLIKLFWKENKPTAISVSQPKCDCGADSVGSQSHSNWCSLKGDSK